MNALHHARGSRHGGPRGCQDVGRRRVGANNRRSTALGRMPHGTRQHALRSRTMLKKSRHQVLSTNGTGTKERRTEGGHTSLPVAELRRSTSRHHGRTSVGYCYRAVQTPPRDKTSVKQNLQGGKRFTLTATSGWVHEFQAVRGSNGAVLDHSD